MRSARVYGNPCVFTLLNLIVGGSREGKSAKFRPTSDTTQPHRQNSPASRTPHTKCATPFSFSNLMKENISPHVHGNTSGYFYSYCWRDCCHVLSVLPEIVRRYCILLLMHKQAQTIELSYSATRLRNRSCVLIICMYTVTYYRSHYSSIHVHM